MKRQSRSTDEEAIVPVVLSERFPTFYAPFPILVQYDPLQDPVPEPGTHFNKTTPAESARKLRALHIHLGEYPVTWPEYWAATKKISAFEMAVWVAAEAGVSWQAAEAVVADICPELYADYWMSLPEFPIERAGTERSTEGGE